MNAETIHEPKAWQRDQTIGINVIAGGNGDSFWKISNCWVADNRVKNSDTRPGLAIVNCIGKILQGRAENRFGLRRAERGVVEPVIEPALNGILLEIEKRLLICRSLIDFLLSDLGSGRNEVRSTGSLGSRNVVKAIGYILRATAEVPRLRSTGCPEDARNRNRRIRGIRVSAVILARLVEHVAAGQGHLRMSSKTGCESCGTQGRAQYGISIKREEQVFKRKIKVHKMYKIPARSSVTRTARFRVPINYA